jgi:hypothetical protein
MSRKNSVKTQGIAFRHCPFILHVIPRSMLSLRPIMLSPPTALVSRDYRSGLGARQRRSRG